ncbi:MAG: hypothetical protein WBX01_04615 [Nitrososphaeraceae archaeon]
MMLALIASVIAVTILHSQDAIASAYAGQTSGSTRVGPADIDVEEAAEAESATMRGATKGTTTSGNMTGVVEFLSIQNAKSGSLSQINATAYTLELNNVANKTIMFSDRPERIVETVSTSNFIGNWATGPNSFSEDEPNDALIVKDTQTGQLETAVIESSNPVYDTTSNTLTYTIMAENGTSIALPEEFGQSILVVDPGGQPGIGT